MKNWCHRHCQCGAVSRRSGSRLDHRQDDDGWLEAKDGGLNNAFDVITICEYNNTPRLRGVLVFPCNVVSVELLFL
jgi:hypothetical protein